MKTYRYETPHSEIKSDRENGIIFLAGPTVRGHQQHLQPSWRFEALELLEKNGFKGTVVVPEFIDQTQSDQHRYDLPVWEMNNMTIADVILFWVPRTKELIALTTNFELGYWIARDRSKVVYGRPDGAYRTDYLDTIWEYDLQNCYVNKIVDRDKIHKDLNSLTQTAIFEVENRLMFEAQYLAKSKI